MIKIAICDDDEKNRERLRELIQKFMREQDTLNHYGYCWNNPLALIDKNGLFPATEQDKPMYMIERWQ